MAAETGDIVVLTRWITFVIVVAAVICLFVISGDKVALTRIIVRNGLPRHVYIYENVGAISVSKRPVLEVMPNSSKVLKITSLGSGSRINHALAVGSQKAPVYAIIVDERDLRSASDKLTLWIDESGLHLEGPVKVLFHKRFPGEL
jgi:hypothetical protein